MADMDMTPPHVNRDYWTAAIWGPFMARLFKLANGGDEIAERYAANLADAYLARIGLVDWIVAQERDNRFSWRLLKGRIKAQGGDTP